MWDFQEYLWVPGVFERFTVLPIGVPVVPEGLVISLIVHQLVFAEIVNTSNHFVCF